MKKIPKHGLSLIHDFFSIVISFLYGHGTSAGSGVRS